MTVEGFRWLMGNLTESMMVDQKITQSIAVFAAGLLLLLILGAVYCCKSRASEKKWLVFKSFVSEAGCLLLVMLEFSLAHFIVLGSRYLFWVSGNVPMLLSECGEEALQGFQIERISMLCAACIVAFFAVLGVSFHCYVRSCKYVRTLAKVHRNIVIERKERQEMERVVRIIEQAKEKQE